MAEASEWTAARRYKSRSSFHFSFGAIQQVLRRKQIQLNLKITTVQTCDPSTLHTLGHKVLMYLAGSLITTVLRTRLDTVILYATGDP